MKLNFLGRKEINFKYPGGEFVLTELTADKFLAAVEALMSEKDVLRFIDCFDILLEHKKAVITSQELFDKFIIEFINLHIGKVDTGEKEVSEKQIKSSLKRFYESYETLLASLWKGGLGDPSKLSKKYTLGQLDRWMQKMFPAEGNENTEEVNDMSVPETPKKDGKLGFHNLPGKAKNIKVWTDKAGHQCRSYEIRM